MEHSKQLIIQAMISTENYFKEVKGIKPSALPEKLKEGYEYVKELTENHSSWKYYNSDPDIKEAVDEYLANLSDHLKKQDPKQADKPSSKISENEAREAAKSLIRAYVKRGDSLESLKSSHLGVHGSDYAAEIQKNKIQVSRVQNEKVNHSFPIHSIYNEILEEENIEPEKAVSTEKKETKKASSKRTVPKKEVKVESATANVNLVERISEEVRFIKRYALMDGKIKTDGQILTFINSLQKAITEKRIRKSSPFAKEMEYIQTNLIKLYNVMGKKVEIKVNDKVLDKFLEITGSEKVRLSVTYLKRYIGIQGKKLTKEKAQRLITLLENAAKRGSVNKQDPYATRLNTAYESLVKFVKTARKNETLEVHQSVLNGIETALGCCCDDKKKGLEGIDVPSALPAHFPEPAPKNAVMSSVDFAKLKFDTLGFEGKWLQLIGDPCEGFTAMVFGKPKMGKSYLCIDFAGYLARNHGNTLYVAKEEKLDATLQKKLDDKNVKHPCLYVSDHLPKDLSSFQFIFLDSVNKIGFQPEDLEKLKANNPGKSFIYVFQTTKEGNFRGANTFQHDVDVVIEVPEKGKAVQFGRFNQGGELEIFK